jgi:hypothetical protein
MITASNQTAHLRALANVASGAESVGPHNLPTLVGAVGSPMWQWKHHAHDPRLGLRRTYWESIRPTPASDANRAIRLFAFSINRAWPTRTTAWSTAASGWKEFEVAATVRDASAAFEMVALGPQQNHSTPSFSGSRSTGLWSTLIPDVGELPRPTDVVDLSNAVRVHGRYETGNWFAPTGAYVFPSSAELAGEFRSAVEDVLHQWLEGSHQSSAASDRSFVVVDTHSVRWGLSATFERALLDATRVASARLAYDAFERILTSSNTRDAAQVLCRIIADPTVQYRDTLLKVLADNEIELSYEPLVTATANLLSSEQRLLARSAALALMSGGEKAVAALDAELKRLPAPDATELSRFISFIG